MTDATPNTGPDWEEIGAHLLDAADVISPLVMAVRQENAPGTRRRLDEIRTILGMAAVGLGGTAEPLAEPAPTDETGVYRERAHLVAFLARLYPAHWSAPDLNDPYGDFAIVCIHTPAGQATWHIAPGDAELFPEMEVQHGHWDGHTTEEKYARLATIVPTDELAGAKR